MVCIIERLFYLPYVGMVPTYLPTSTALKTVVFCWGYVEVKGESCKVALEGQFAMTAYDCEVIEGNSE